MKNLAVVIVEIVNSLQLASMKLLHNMISILQLIAAQEVKRPQKQKGCGNPQMN